MAREVLGEDVSNDPSVIAIDRDIAEGKFEGVPSGTYIAYSKGEYVGMGSNRKELIDRLYKEGVGTDIVLEQVGVPKDIIKFRKPLRFLDSK